MTLFAGTALAVPNMQRDLDVNAVTVYSYLRHDNEFIVTVRGGFGKWVDAKSESLTEVDMTEATLTFGFTDPDERKVTMLCDSIERILDRWAGERTLLQLAAAPGTQTVLAENPSRYLPIPRTD